MDTRSVLRVLSGSCRRRRREIGMKCNTFHSLDWNVINLPAENGLCQFVWALDNSEHWALDAMTRIHRWWPLIDWLNHFLFARRKLNGITLWVSCFNPNDLGNHYLFISLFLCLAHLCSLCLLDGLITVCRAACDCELSSAGHLIPVETERICMIIQYFPGLSASEICKSKFSRNMHYWLRGRWATREERWIPINTWHANAIRNARN